MGKEGEGGGDGGGGGGGGEGHKDTVQTTMHNKLV